MPIISQKADLEKLGCWSLRQVVRREVGEEEWMEEAHGNWAYRVWQQSKGGTTRAGQVPLAHCHQSEALEAKEQIEKSISVACEFRRILLTAEKVPRSFLSLRRARGFESDEERQYSAELTQRQGLGT